MCTTGGLALAAGLYHNYEKRSDAIEQQNQYKMTVHYVDRLEESTHQWLVWCDLIYGNGNTYLVQGATEHATLLDQILTDIQSNLSDDTAIDSVLELKAFVDANRRRLESTLSLQTGQQPDLYPLLLELDNESPAAIQSIKGLKNHTASRVSDHAVVREAINDSVFVHSTLMIAGYIFLVLIVWRYTTTRMIRPIAALIESTEHANDRHGSFDLTERGPHEIRKLTQTLYDFATELDGQIHDLERTNQSLADEMAERRLVEENLRKSEATLRISEDRFHSIFRQSNDAIFVIDVAKDRFMDANPQACRLLGYEYEELITMSPSAVHEKEIHSFESFCETVVDHSHGRTEELACQQKSGALIPAEISASSFTAADGTQCILALVRDISERKRSEAEREALHQRMVEHTRQLEVQGKQLQLEVQKRQDAQERLQYEALHDALTDLPNRRLFQERLDHSIAKSKRNPEYKFAVLFIDLDNFKIVNDSLGHDAGDELLVNSASRLVSSLRDLDCVGFVDDESTARLGGDEFIVLLDDIKEPSDAISAAERIQEALTEPHIIAGQQVAVGASIGIAICNEACTNSEDLLRDADTAMYRAKFSGKSQHAVFDQAMHNDVAARLSLESELRRAVENNELELRYQPIVCLSTTEIDSFEALIRWNRDGHGYVPPSDFIPVAEDTSLIVPLGYWVLREACLELNRINELRPAGREIKMAVNVSQKQLEHEGFVGDVVQILKETGVEPNLLKLEVTESMVMSDPETITRILTQLREEDILIAMDDFGTGYSSLSSLHSLPLNVLKIDQAFISNMSCDVEYAAIVSAIITLAGHLGLDVVAEGIQTSEQMAQMLALECAYAQGYLFSKPVTGQEARAMVNRAFRLRISA